MNIKETKNISLNEIQSDIRRNILVLDIIAYASRYLWNPSSTVFDNNLH